MPFFIYLLLQFFPSFSLKIYPRTGSLDCSHGRSKLNRFSYAGRKSSYKAGALGTCFTRKYSTNSAFSLHPQFITGFSDAESSFFITFIKSNKSITGFYIQLSFQIGLHKKDRFLLELIKSYFGVGNILTKNKDMVFYQVTSIKDLAVVVCHFNKYPLITKKRADFELFKMAFNMINKKDHLNTKGFMKILSLKSALNLGLPSNLKTAFPGIIPYLRPQVLAQPIKDPQ